jgi:hypothetical protein
MCCPKLQEKEPVEKKPGGHESESESTVRRLRYSPKKAVKPLLRPPLRPIYVRISENFWRPFPLLPTGTLVFSGETVGYIIGICEPLVYSMLTLTNQVITSPGCDIRVLLMPSDQFYPDDSVDNEIGPLPIPTMRCDDNQSDEASLKSKQIKREVTGVLLAHADHMRTQQQKVPTS